MTSEKQISDSLESIRSAIIQSGNAEAANNEQFKLYLGDRFERLGSRIEALDSTIKQASQSSTTLGARLNALTWALVTVGALNVLVAIWQILAKAL